MLTEISGNHVIIRYLACARCTKFTLATQSSLVMLGRICLLMLKFWTLYLFVYVEVLDSYPPCINTARPAASCRASKQKQNQSIRGDLQPLAATTNIALTNLSGQKL